MGLRILVTLLLGYMLGNLNGAVCMSALLHDDVRSHGSGNAGLTNFIRNYGKGQALYVVLIDAGKAVLACMAGGLLLEAHFSFTEGAMLAGVAVMLGHIYPAVLGFKGGKGVLSGFMIAVVADWRIALGLLAVFLAVYFLCRYVSLGSVLASVAFGIGFCILYHQSVVILCCALFMAGMTVFTHRKNILRLIRGQERRTHLFTGRVD